MGDPTTKSGPLADLPEVNHPGLASLVDGVEAGAGEAQDDGGGAVEVVEDAVEEFCWELAEMISAVLS